MDNRVKPILLLFSLFVVSISCWATSENVRFPQASLASWAVYLVRLFFCFFFGGLRRERRTNNRIAVLRLKAQ
jgi:hypothetical protein